MKYFRHISVFFVSIALAVLLLPEVLQVSFHNHEHTEDVQHTCCDFHFEELHNHCLEVDFYVTSVYFTGISVLDFVQEHFEVEQFYAQSVEWVDIYPQFLRGPPTLVS